MGGSSRAGDHELQTVKNGSDSDGPLMVGDIKFVKEAKTAAKESVFRLIAPVCPKSFPYREKSRELCWT
jgi:hypothetical protein